MNFLKTMTQKIEGVSSTAPPQQTAAKREIFGKEVLFTHSPFIYIPDGIYKGRVGEIIAKIDQRLEVAIKGVDYTIVDLYEIETQDNIIKVLKNEIRRIVAFYDDTDKKNKIGMLAGTTKKNKNTTNNVFVIIPYDLDYKSTQDIWVLLAQLTNMLKKGVPHRDLLKKKLEQNIPVEDIMNDITNKMKNVKVDSEEMDLDMENLTKQIKEVKIEENVQSSQSFDFVFVSSDKLIKNQTSPIELQRREKEEQMKEFMERTLKIEYKLPERKDGPSLDLILVVSGQHIGEYGKFIRIINETKTKEYDKFVLVNKKDFKPSGNKNYEIGVTGMLQYGPYDKEKAKIVNIYPETFFINVFLPEQDKKVMLQTEKDWFQETPDYKPDLSPITQDLFLFIDAKLKNGNFFQVDKLFEDGKMIGKELIEDQFVQRTKNKEEIESFNQGFDLGGLKKENNNNIVERDDDIVERDEDIVIGDNKIDEEGFVIENSKDENVADDEEQEEPADIDYGESDEVREEQEKATEENDVYKDGYKDTQRTQMSITLSKEQEAIKTKFTKYLNLYGVDIKQVMTYVKQAETVTGIQKTMETMKKEVDKYKEGYWKASDEKYIIACYVYYEILKLGQDVYNPKGENDMISTFINMMELKDDEEQNENDLMPKSKKGGGIFRKTDIPNSIFLTNGWTSAFIVDTILSKKLYKEEKYTQLYRMMFLNAHKTIQSYVPDRYKLDIEKQIEAPKIEMFALKRTKPKFEKNVALIQDILSGDIPATAKKIVWGLRYIPILQQYKDSIKNTIDSAKSARTKKIYTYVLENIEQAPFALKMIDEKILKDGLEMDKLKKQRLEKMFNSLKEELRENIQITEAGREKAREQTALEMKELRERREKITEEQESKKRLFGDTESESESDIESEDATRKTARTGTPRGRYWITGNRF